MLLLLIYLNIVKVFCYYDSWLQASLPNNFWCSIALSSSGQYIGTVSNGITSFNTAGSVYISADYGSTWSAVTSVPSSSWTFITLSYSGQHMVIVGGGGNIPGGSTSQSYIYTSSNYGSSWTQSSAILSSWSGVASNASGAMIVALSTSGIYISSDYGQLWSLSSSSSNTQVASSACGQYLISSNTVPLGNIFISSNYGAIWST